MKKRILVIISSYSIGGTISSLCSLLSVIDKDQIEFDIFARSQVGQYEGRLPNCHLLDENIWLSHDIYHRSLLVRFLVRFLWFIRHVFEFVGVDLFRVYNRIGGRQIHSEKYDAIIGYDETFARFISFLPAQRRINWIHCDYRRFAKGKDESKYYDRIDSIVCVSEFVKGIFCEVYPQYSHKTYAIHNAINFEQIREYSKAPITDNRFTTTCFTIVSCGRLDPVKQFSKIPYIAAKLIEMTEIPFKWYIIGGGNELEKKEIEDEIAKHHVQNCVIMLGLKTNVFPYMANSDLYVCTSSSESFPMVVNEAKALFIPVISNCFPSARESIRDEIDGKVCHIEDMASVIHRQMINPMTISIDAYNNENSQIVDRFLSLLNLPQ